MELEATHIDKEENSLKAINCLKLNHNTKVILLTKDMSLKQKWQVKLQKYLNYYQFIHVIKLSVLGRLKLKFNQESIIFIVDEDYLDDIHHLINQTNEIENHKLIIIYSGKKKPTLTAMSIHKDAIDFVDVVKQFNQCHRGIRVF